MREKSVCSYKTNIEKKKKQVHVKKLFSQVSPSLVFRKDISHNEKIRSEFSHN